MDTLSIREWKDVSAEATEIAKIKDTNPSLHKLESERILKEMRVMLNLERTTLRHIRAICAILNVLIPQDIEHELEQNLLSENHHPHAHPPVGPRLKSA